MKSTTRVIQGTLFGLALAGMATVAAAGTVQFEQFTVDGAPWVLGAEDHYNGYDLAPSPADEMPEVHPFTSDGVEFYNSYGEYTYNGFSYSSWEGWAVSNMTDTTTPGYLNQYSAITGGGVCGTTNYGIGYLPDNSWWGGDPTGEVFRRAPVELAHTDVAGRCGIYVTNTTYGYLTMRDGEGQARAFTAGNDDFLCLSITGLDAAGEAIVGLDPVDFYLADFRRNREPGAVAGDYIVDAWRWVDLESLVDGGAAQLQFLFSAADVGDYGINTPVYFAVDNLPSIPGDASCDGTVDEADAAILADAWGETTGMQWTDGDFNADGAVDMRDAAILAANWGASIAPEGVSSTPEPATLALLVAALLTLVTRRRRR